MMETSARNKPGNHSSSVFGYSDVGDSDVGGPLIVTSHGTPRTPIEGTSDASHVVTPVTQAALDPLMHSSTLNGPQGISPSVIEIPPTKSYTHVSVHDFYSNTLIFPIVP
jgi:hypothetical protein